MSSTVSIIAVLEARRRIAPHVRRTPLVRSAWLSRATGADVWLKLESQQRTNAFKVRGGFNAALRLAESGERPTLVTASAGNHGWALAEAAAATGMSCVVFTPSDAPRTKLDAIEAAGARLDALSATTTPPRAPRRTTPRRPAAASSRHMRFPTSSPAAERSHWRCSRTSRAWTWSWCRWAGAA